jgi:hypothetical protein
VVVGWGFTNGDPWTQKADSDFAKGGTSASQLQQVVDLPIIANDEVMDRTIFIYKKNRGPSHYTL